MSDVQEQPVVEEVVETTQTEEVEVQDQVAEVESTPEEKPKGDLSVALRQEREKRQALEERLKEYESTHGQAEEVEEEEEVIPFDPNNVQSLVRFEMEKEKALEKYPELKKDKDLQVMVTSFINAGLSPTKAADKVMSRFTQVKQEAKIEGMREEAQVLTDKEQAQTVSGVSKNSADVELESLQEQARSMNPKKKEEALLKLLELDFRKSRGK